MLVAIWGLMQALIGYGDIIPQTIPAKFLTMTEILVAFTTVIFLLSDFISLKESVARKKNLRQRGAMLNTLLGSSAHAVSGRWYQNSTTSKLKLR